MKPWAQSRQRQAQPRAYDERCCLRAQEAYRRGDLAGAEFAYRQAVAAGTKIGDAYNNLGALCEKRDALDEAVVHLEAGLRVAPQRSDLRENLQIVLRRRVVARSAGQEFAEVAVDRARLAALEPDTPNVWHDLGAALDRAGRPLEAVAAFREGLARAPRSAALHNDLGVVLMKLGDGPAALAALESALAADPTLFEALVNLGVLLGRMGKVGEAAAALRRALARDPRSASVHWNLANALREGGDLPASLRHYETALPLVDDTPRRLACLSAYLLTLNYDDTSDADAVALAHRRYEAEVRARAGAPVAVRPRDPRAERRLRVGYLSPDLRQHSVAYFLEGVLAGHDRAQVEVTAYADDHMEDGTTVRLRALADRWRNVAGISGEALRAIIAEDGIDVLVDLAGHSSANRLALLATRVAPVQVTYLGYPNTTGLSQMDVRITDEVADPEGAAAARHSERLARLPGGFLCYTPAPEAASLPPAGRAQGRPFTFGSFNQIAKLSPSVIGAWSDVLARVPGARLWLKAKGLDDDATCADVLRRFAAAGVREDRLTLVGYVHSKTEHFQAYEAIDLALDPFPYNGTTTTCEALWMGVPVLTLAGAAHAGRVGASILARVGLPSLVALTIEAYVATAVRLATDAGALAELRRGLRDRLQGSPLMDRARIGHALEASYREAWRRTIAADA